MTVGDMGTDTGRAESALSAVAAGEPVVLVDRDGHGVLAFAAGHATTSLLAFTVRHTSGFVRVALRAETCDRLDLPPMYGSDEIHRVTVDLDGHGTGISAADRAATIAALADPSSTPELFTRPGHVVPVLAREGGVLLDDSTVQATSDLAELAGSAPAGAFCELVSAEDPLGISGPDEAGLFAAEHGLALLSIGDLVAYRRRCAPGLRRGRRSSVTTAYGRFDTLDYTTPSGEVHTALLAGTPEDGVDVPVHLRRPCLAREALGPQACPCGRQTDAAILAIAARGRGVVLNLRQASPPSTCTEQDADSFESDVDAAIGILSDLNIRSFQLIPEHRDGRPRAGTAVGSGAVSR
ncbi:hypothetical protein GCM10023108_12200 [Saccharopolyspora hordei]